MKNPMTNKSAAIIGITFALPLLSPTMAEAAPTSNQNQGNPLAAPTPLTESELDAVTAGHYQKLPVLPRPWPKPWPIWTPIKKPPVATTLAIGEEGGCYPYPIMTGTTDRP